MATSDLPISNPFEPTTPQQEKNQAQQSSPNGNPFAGSDDWGGLTGSILGTIAGSTVERIAIGALGVLLILIGIAFWLETDIVGVFKKAGATVASNPEVLAA